MSGRRFVWLVPAVLTALVMLTPAWGQDRPPRKVAFLVGVMKYDHDFPNLQFPERDVEELGKVLKDGGFEVIVLTGSGTGKDRATRKNIEARLQAMVDGDGDDTKKIKKGDLILVALSGHGQQLFVKDPTDVTKQRDDAFFCPADGKSGKPETLVSISHLVDELLAPCGARNLLLVDACRDIADPNKGKGVEGRDVKFKGETAVLFSCGRGEKSWENADLKHGVFTHAVLKGLKGDAAKKGEVTWTGLVGFVEDEMASKEFKALLPKGYDQTPIPTSGQLPRTILLASLGDLASGEKVEEFEYVIDGEKKKGKRRVLTVDVSDGEKMEFVRIKAGTFQMGAPEGEKESGDDEKPLRKVEITKDFYLGKYEVTQAQYKALTGETPSGFKGDRLPVDTVSWDDAVKFCEALSKKVKRNADLPSEAQWEYACRAGTITPFHFGSKLNGDLANCDGNFPYGTDVNGTNKKKTVAVGSYPANPWGLYDMHGNVYEWCQDYYGPYDKVVGLKDPLQLNKQSDNYRVLRGGSWYSSARQCRAAFRGWYAPDNRGYIAGFRVCLPVD